MFLSSCVTRLACYIGFYSVNTKWPFLGFQSVCVFSCNLFIEYKFLSLIF